MAFQPYLYPGYQPPYYSQPVPDQLTQLRQQQMMQQPQAQMQPVQLPQPVGPQNNGMVWVSGKAEADGYQVPPGSAVALWDANNPVIYLRQADNTGKPSTKVYDLVERAENQPAQQPAPQIDMSNVVTWDKLDEYLTERLKRPSKAAQKKEDTDNA